VHLDKPKGSQGASDTSLHGDEPDQAQHGHLHSSLASPSASNSTKSDSRPMPDGSIQLSNGELVIISCDEEGIL